MYGNDQYGNCLIEGTKILAPNVSKGCRARYSGPVVTLILDSGNQVTVTPNHQILTPRGFVSACLLNEGDHVISCAFPQQVAACLQPDFDESPTLVEDKFAALLATPHNRLSKMMPLPVNFNGDAEFFNGDIEVVSPERFLRSDFDASLGEPQGKRQVGSSGKLQSSLTGSSASFGRDEGVLLSTSAGLSSQRKRRALVSSHTGVQELEGLFLGSKCDASVAKIPLDSLKTHSRQRFADILHRPSGAVLLDQPVNVGYGELGFAEYGSRNASRSQGNSSHAQPAVNGLSTDPELSGDILNRFSGLIKTDRIMHVNVNDFRGHVYDFTTSQHWYLANGIVTHNCVIAAMAHIQNQAQFLTSGKFTDYTLDQILSMYSAIGGYVPGDGPGGPSDQGCDMLTALKYWKSSGFLGSKITAYMEVDPQNATQVDQAIAQFGSLFIGVQLPVAVQLLPNWPAPPVSLTGDWEPGSWGGHCVPPMDYSPGSEICVSWGAKLTIADPFFTAYCDEAYVVLFPGWIAANGKSPSGLNLAQLQADIAAL
jgi:hypothetical protein